ncbi:MAG: hypothetical protein C5B54_04400 [Acidobacteria bacterium]|nr:MAG: hypothetical protein C5B54_04400 [Acidobacteriota bacterium]
MRGTRWDAFILVIALIIFLPIASRALDPQRAFTQYVHDIWDTDQGLPENTVYCITQTQDGFLWVGTEEGLARFDGVRFTVFDKTNTPEIKDNIINALFEDREGNLWIGTYGGGLTKYKDGHFVHYGTERGLVDDHVICITQGANDAIWIGTTTGLSKFHDGKFESFQIKQGLTDNWIASIADDHAGGLWIGTAKGLCHLQNEKITPVLIAGSEVIFCVYSLLPDDVWIGTFKTLNHLSHGQIDSYKLSTQAPNIPVRAIYQDRENNFWVATLGAGLNRFRNGTFESFTSDMVHSLYEDREGNLWMGTSNGLSRLRNGKFLSYSAEEGLSLDRVWCVFEDSQKQVWIGTDGGGLNLFQNGKFTKFTIHDGLSSDLISSIAEDHDGNLWIGTLGGGVNRFNHGHFTHFTPENGLAGTWIWSIHPAQDGSILIGTYNHGLSVLKDGKFTNYNISNGFPSNSIHSIWESRDGSLYFATVGAGLVCWKDGKVTTYSTKQGLSSNDLTSIYGDRNGVLWIATANQGLIRFENGHAINITEKEGLLDDDIEGILEDDRGNLWMSTNRGIFTVQKAIIDDFVSGKIHRLEISSFGKSDGMKSEECNGGYQSSAWKSQDGRLWFANNKGIVVIDPKRIPINRHIPPVLIQEISVDNEQIQQPSSSAVFQPGKDKFEFHYTALSYTAPEKVRFKFKLEGSDKDWVNAGTRRVAYYTHLPPGSYQFKVQACNNDGIWNEAGAIFAFRLKPHFYQTVWFYLLCALSVAASAFVLHRYRLGQIQARFNAILAERNRLARELHDTLAQGMTGIISQLNAAEEHHPSSPDRSLKHLVQARDLARENLNEARNAIRGMRPQYLEKHSFVPALGHMATDLISNTPVELNLQINGDERSLPSLVEDNLLRIAQEAVTNCVKYAQAKSLSIELRFQPRRVELRIADDGIGFDFEKARSLDGHFGLIGIQERARQLAGDARIASSVGKGTEILVSIPLA